MVRIGTAHEETRVAGERQALLDGMSIVLASERGNAALYERYAGETTDQALRSHWQRFGQQAQSHRQLAEGAITALGGDPTYRSAGALELERSTEAMLIVAESGAMADVLRLGHLIGAESLSRLYWRGVGRVAPRLKDRAAARSLADTAALIEREKNQSVAWNTSALESRLARVMAGR